MNTEILKNAIQKYKEHISNIKDIIDKWKKTILSGMDNG